MAGLALASAALLAGCEGPGESAPGYKAFTPLSPDMLALMRSKATDQNAPMLIRAYKKEAELEVWKSDRTGKYVYLKTYPMCRWSGQLGPKLTAGDRQVPEGFYAVTPGQMNPNSHYYLSFNIGYPNAYDRANGRTGDSIMVHGICSSAGCFSMTDRQIEEIYALARESFAGGQRAIQMQSLPFRMTAENIAKLRLDPNMPFWRELKKGADYFEVTKRDVPVGVCDKRYVFGATPKSGRFDALSACPPLTEEPGVRLAVASRTAADDKSVADLIARGLKPVRIVYKDGGQNPEFANRIAEVSRPDALIGGPAELALDDNAAGRPVPVQIAAGKARASEAADTTGSIAAKATVPATFGAAPSAYAGGETRSATESFFARWLDGAATKSVSPLQAEPMTVSAGSW